MKLKDKIKEISGINESLIGQFLEYNMVGSFLNFIEEAINELGDEEITKKFEELQELIMDKRKKLNETEITALTDSEVKKHG